MKWARPEHLPDPDGLGDTSYRVAGTTNSLDYYPLMKPFFEDTAAPTWPSGSILNVSRLTATSLALNWTAAEDDSGVTGYRVYQDNILVSNLTGNIREYHVAGLRTSTTYVFKVEAGDRLDNWSTDGPSATVTTSAKPFWLSALDFFALNWRLILIPIAVS